MKARLTIAALLLAWLPALAHAQEPEPAPAPDDPSPETTPTPAPTEQAPEAPQTEEEPPFGNPAPGNAAPPQRPGPKPDEEDTYFSRIRKSIFMFDQSVRTQTAQLEGLSPQQSYVPSYEWWFSFRPVYWFWDHTTDLEGHSGGDGLHLDARIDYFKDLTNDLNTTYFREDTFSDTWLTLVYQRHYSWMPGRTSVVAGGPRLLFPTSKISQANDMYVNAGVTAELYLKKIPLRTDGSQWFKNFSFRTGFWFSHPFTRATSATGLGFQLDREATDGRTFVSDQITGGLLTNYQLQSYVRGDLAINDKFSFVASAFLISMWKYGAPAASTITVGGGEQINVSPTPGAATFVNNTWLLFAVDYDPMDELTFSLGYYNLANEIAPDGQRRAFFGGDNIWWSPDARVFLTATANLDHIWDDIIGAKRGNTESNSARKSAPSALP